MPCRCPARFKYENGNCECKATANRLNSQKIISTPAIDLVGWLLTDTESKLECIVARGVGPLAKAFVLQSDNTLTYIATGPMMIEYCDSHKEVETIIGRPLVKTDFVVSISDTEDLTREYLLSCGYKYLSNVYLAEGGYAEIYASETCFVAIAHRVSDVLEKLVFKNWDEYCTWFWTYCMCEQQSDEDVLGLTNDYTNALDIR